MNYFIVTILSINILLLILGIFAKSFQDNLLQRIGLIILALFEVIRVSQIVQGEAINPLRQWIHIGIFFYCVGTLLKYLIRVDYVPRWPSMFITHTYNRREDDPKPQQGVRK